MIAALLWAACSGDGAPALPDLNRPASEPTWGTAELEAALTEALADGFPEPWSIRDDYLDFFAHGDGTCPAHDDYLDDTQIYGCTTESGYWFSGISDYVTESDASSGTEYWVVAGDLLFIDPEGLRFEGGGHMIVDAVTTGEEMELGALLMGTWGWEGHEGWLGGEGSSSALELSWSQSGEGTRLTIDGATNWSGLSLYFDALVFTSDCDAPTEGALSIRDPSGAWHWTSPSDCAPCAEVFFGGADGEGIGEACLDLSPITDDLMLRTIDLL